MSQTSVCTTTWGPVVTEYPSFLMPPYGTVIVSDRCTACANCIITCPTSALKPAPAKPLVLDALCNLCGECIEVCPVGAIIEVPGSLSEMIGQRP